MTHFSESQPQALSQCEAVQRHELERKALLIIGDTFKNFGLKTEDVIQQRLLPVLYMDLDGFKQVNDNLGHHAGDLLLTTVADRLSTCVRESDTVARLGGDEFTIVLTETHKQEDVAMIAQKIIDAISVPFDLEGEQARIGISIGIARYSDEADNEDELMKHADQAMYQAKLGGKNTYRFASDH
jgi:diguanylate cyclase (GGDEF)-like protein